LWTHGKVKVHWLGHDSIVLEGSKTLVIDPYSAGGNFRADLILISHEHSDHLSPDDIRRFATPATKIIAPKICENGLSAFRMEKTFLSPNSRVDVQGVTIETVPAYNLNKFRSPGQVFHPRQDGRVGYVVTLDGSRFYHAGDSDATPEMRSTKADVAFLPVSGIYVMTPEEAAEAARAMKPKVAVPMHYGAGVAGTVQDALRFRQLLKGFVEVVVLDKEG